MGVIRNYTDQGELWVTFGSGWWTFPSIVWEDQCVFTAHALDTTHYADSPSDTLRTLIEAQAPAYVIIERMIEEYPQWAEHFEAAWAAELAEREGVA